jgi:hypothetical protein
VSATRLADAGQPRNDDQPRHESWSATLQKAVITLAEQGPSLLLAIAVLLGHH